MKSNKNSGQLLIIAALAIALLISSTTIYVYELSEETDSKNSTSAVDIAPMLKQCTRNAMISALANISNGGATTTLETNLAELFDVFRGLEQLAIFNLTFNLLNDYGYESGVRLFWGIEGMGFSSAYADFTLLAQGTENIEWKYSLNITTAVFVESEYLRDGSETIVNLTCRVYNEVSPALAKNMSVFYELEDSWVQADASITDFCNGTYMLSFIIPNTSSAQVSMRVYDLREILVYANVTCREA